MICSLFFFSVYECSCGLGEAAPHHKGFLALASGTAQNVVRWGGFSDLGHGLSLDMTREHLWHLQWLRTEE